MQQQGWQQQRCRRRRRRHERRTELRSGPRGSVFAHVIEGEPCEVPARSAAAYDTHDRSAPRRSVPRRYTNSTLYHSRFAACDSFFYSARHYSFIRCSSPRYVSASLVRRIICGEFAPSRQRCILLPPRRKDAGMTFILCLAQ